jgi:hypothetical protein
MSACCSNVQMCSKYEKLVFIYCTSMKNFHVTFRPVEEFTDIHKYKEVWYVTLYSVFLIVSACIHLPLGWLGQAEIDR